MLHKAVSTLTLHGKAVPVAVFLIFIGPEDHLGFLHHPGDTCFRFCGLHNVTAKPAEIGLIAEYLHRKLICSQRTQRLSLLVR
ncbi:hypothetical protein D3C76_1534470 [compost metagenome]